MTATPMRQPAEHAGTDRSRTDRAGPDRAGLDRAGLDRAACYRAVSSRDRRFDGMFYTAVRTTKIYCRPSCPAITPKLDNVEFYVSAAAAQSAGFRACKRCIPDASPGSPDWNRRGDAVARAVRMVDDGVVDREGVGAIAARLGYSERQLHRLLVDELGAGALAIARARRAHTARSLIESSDLSLTDIAFASGFGSVRQFNDTIRAVYAATPSELRSRRRIAPSGSGAITVRLGARQPFAGEQLFSFLAARAVPGVEHATATTYARSLDLPSGHGVVTVALGADGIEAEFVLSDLSDLTPAVVRLRRLFDLDADPIAVDRALAESGVLAPLVAATPGLRSAGSVDPWETVIRAIIGQQVSVAGARTVTAKLVAGFDERLTVPHPELRFVFPRPDALAAIDPTEHSDRFAMPRARAQTLVGVARAIQDGAVDLDADRDQVRSQLLALRGVGPWTADYVMMRGFSDPDVFLTTDLGVRHALDALGTGSTETGSTGDGSAGDGSAGDGSDWSPWRTYALHHLWHSLGAPRPLPASTSSSPPEDPSDTSDPSDLKDPHHVR